jgi:hypothetical protein
MRTIKSLFIILILSFFNSLSYAQNDTSKVTFKKLQNGYSIEGEDVLMAKIAIYDSTKTQAEFKEAIINWSQEAFTNRTAKNDISTNSQVFINYITDFGSGFGAANVNALMKIYIRDGKIKVEVFYTTFSTNGNTVKYVVFKKDGTIRNSKTTIMSNEEKDVNNLINSLIHYLNNELNVEDDF